MAAGKGAGRSPHQAALHAAQGCLCLSGSSQLCKEAGPWFGLLPEHGWGCVSQLGGEESHWGALLNPVLWHHQAEGKGSIWFYLEHVWGVSGRDTEACDPNLLSLGWEPSRASLRQQGQILSHCPCAQYYSEAGGERN